MEAAATTVEAATAMEAAATTVEAAAAMEAAAMTAASTHHRVGRAHDKAG
jgi:hypothetical protein